MPAGPEKMHCARARCGGRRWMRHCADQLASGPARQARIRIQRDHIADALGRARSFATDGEERGIRRPSQQSIQLAELSTLPFPSHPFPLPFVPKPPPMEQEEAPFASGQRPMEIVQALDAGNRGRQKLPVARGVLACGVWPVGEDCEMDLPL